MQIVLHHKVTRSQLTVDAQLVAVGYLLGDPAKGRASAGMLAGLCSLLHAHSKPQAAPEEQFAKETYSRDNSTRYSTVLCGNSKFV